MIALLPLNNELHLRHGFAQLIAVSLVSIDFQSK